jgi:hypothetical protein
MTLVYVARSAAFTKWASDVGLGKHVFKVGCAADKDELDAAIAAGWAGETDWKPVRTREAETASEDAIFARLAAREKLVEPFYYPRLKGATGIFRVTLIHVERSILLQRALTGESETAPIKAKPADIADYLIRVGLG